MANFVKDDFNHYKMIKEDKIPIYCPLPVVHDAADACFRT
jgi:hypothetical protein